MPQLQLDSSEIPQWILGISLKNAVTQYLGGGFQEILELSLDNLTQAEDVFYLILGVTVTVQIKADTKKNINFILKTQQLAPTVTKISKSLQLISKEELMYKEILPKFEELYSNAGKPVKLAPRSFTIDTYIGHDYVLFEDLTKRGYQHGNRTQGLDMLHMKEALKKVAEFHAASACFVEKFGMFKEKLTQSIYNDANKSWLKEYFASKDFLCQVKQIKPLEKVYEKLLESDDKVVDLLLDMGKVNTKEFNVLNHGDCWVNNILFQHDAFGVIKDTVLVDFQVSKYGSPALDLYYLILTSSDPKIKLSQFDYMVNFYYECLIENLTLLQYSRPLPKLKNLHASLLNHGLIAYLVISKVLPVVLYGNPSSTASSKVNAYNNLKYLQSVEELLSWINNRGGLDWV